MVGLVLLVGALLSNSIFAEDLVPTDCPVGDTCKCEGGIYPNPHCTRPNFESSCAFLEQPTNRPPVVCYWRPKRGKTWSRARADAGGWGYETEELGN